MCYLFVLARNENDLLFKFFFFVAITVLSDRKSSKITGRLVCNYYYFLEFSTVLSVSLKLSANQMHVSYVEAIWQYGQAFALNSHIICHGGAMFYIYVFFVKLIHTP